MTTRAEELLLLLCRHPNTLVTRNEILNFVWAGTVVEDAVVTNCVWQIRKALGEHDKHLLQTRSRRGYQMTIADECWCDQLDVCKPESTPGPQAGFGVENREPHPETRTSIMSSTESVAPLTAFSIYKVSSRMPPQLWFAAGVIAAALFAGVLLWFQKETIAHAPSTVITPTTDSIAVMVVAPDHEDAVRTTILQRAAMLAYLRDMTLRTMRHDWQHYQPPRLALTVEVLGEAEHGVTATIKLANATKIESQTYRGPAAGLAEAAQRMLESRLPPAVRTLSPAGEAHVSGVVAEQRLDMVNALALYRKALALDPQLIPARIAVARYGFAQGRWQEATGLIQPLIRDRKLPKGYRCDLSRLLLDVAPEHLREKAVAESRSACG